MTTVVMCPGLEAVVIFGGSHGEFKVTWQSPGFPKLTETIIYSFGMWCCIWVLPIHVHVDTHDSVHVCHESPNPYFCLYAENHDKEWVLLEEGVLECK
jgi:hypothetical protein